MCVDILTGFHRLRLVGIIGPNRRGSAPIGLVNVASWIRGSLLKREILNVHRATDGLRRFPQNGSMTVPPEPIRMLKADRFHDGMEITFADGTSVFYGSQFLYDHRDAEGTRDVTDDPET